jgi:hypothetical protein
MPLQWTIDAQERFMSVLATGTVSRADVDGFIDAVMSNSALAYRKFFDASRAVSSMTAEETIGLGKRFRSVHTGAVVGPLALVMPRDRGDHLERMLGMIAVADRPMRVFTNREKARLWIEGQA